LQVKLEELNLTRANGDGLRRPSENPHLKRPFAGKGTAIRVIVVGARMRTSSPHRRGLK
jgi:hypothetical protein